MVHCFSYVVVASKKKVKKKFFFTFLYLRKTDMVLGKKVAIFDWEWGRNSVPREGQVMPCSHACDRIITLRGSTSAISSLFFLLIVISQIPQNR